MKKFYLAAIASIAALAIIGCAPGHGTSPKGKEIPIEKAVLKFISDVKDGGYKTVSSEELKKMIDGGTKLLIISSLPAEEDKSFGILPGAVNGTMPKTEKEFTDAHKENLLKIAGTDKEINVVVYCGFVACRRSHIAAKLLVESGFKNVYRYPGGITAWSEMGYPLTK